MLIGDTELYMALSLVNGTEVLDLAQTATGTRCVQVRRFAVPVQAMREMLEYWNEDDYHPNEATEWQSHFAEETDPKSLVYIRYVSQCQHPTTSEDRCTEDIRLRKDGILCHFLSSIASLCPQAYHAGKVLVFATTFANDVDSDVVDDYERLLIGFLGYEPLLNRQKGGYHDSLILQVTIGAYLPLFLLV